MKKMLQSLVLSICFFMLLSFTITPQELLGTWKWVYMENAKTGSRLDISKMTMGMAKEVKFKFNDDNSFAEMKTRAEDDKVSSNPGTWKLNQEGTELTIEQNGKMMPSKIISFKNDTLILSTPGPLHLVMVKEK